MANYKFHFASTNKTKDYYFNSPICGKVSYGIEYETLTKIDFEQTPQKNRCKNCNQILKNT